MSDVDPRFLEAVKARAKAPLKDIEQQFLLDIAPFLELDKWEPVTYDCAAQLFFDYVKGLEILGDDTGRLPAPRAKQIGLTPGVALPLFNYPTHNLRTPVLTDTLSRVKALL